jgi:calcineurin-like phosphoesterase family protein
MTIFVTSDHHFGHERMCSFLRPNGEKVRPWSCAAEMDEALIERWNAVVGPSDKVYHLGDVAIPRSGLQALTRLNGKKILIRGNHDIYPLKDYAAHFKDVRGAFFLEGIMLTHIPIHPDHFRGRYKGNAHGHLHANETMLNGQPDRRYFNSCVEMHNFFPVPWEEVKASLLQ